METHEETHEETHAETYGETKPPRRRLVMVATKVPADFYEEWREKCCPSGIISDRLRELLEEDLARTLGAEIARGPVGQVKRELEAARKKEEEGFWVRLPDGRRFRLG
jgi:hypothetical protein